MSTSSKKSLVAASDIAELAGVSRAAVSNWRRRHDDFPAQVAGTQAKPLYSLAEVTTWLTSQGYSVNQVSAEATVWAALNTLRGAHSPEQAASIVLAVAGERVMGDEVPSSRLGLPVDMSSPEVNRVRQAIDSVDESELASVVDFTLERTARAQGRMAGMDGFVGSRTSQLLASLALSRPGEVVYDPACGIASALLEVADGEAFERYVGHDINTHATATAEIRAALRDVPLHTVTSDVLRADPEPTLRADAIIAEPPFGLRMDIDTRLTDPRFVFGAPPAQSGDTAWFQHAIAHLTDNGRAFIITTHGSLFRRAESRIRAEMLQQGCIEAVVGLPPRMLPHTSIHLALWVLRRPNEENSDVLLIDAQDVESVEKNVARWLTEPSMLSAVPHTRVPVEDLINDDSQLPPARWIATDDRSTDEVRTDFANAAMSLRQATQALGKGAEPAFFTPDTPSRTLTVGELINEGVIELDRGRSIRDADEETKSATVPAGAVHTGQLPEPLAPDLVRDGMVLTAPGDILVTTQFSIQTLLDEQGGHLLPPAIDRLRVLKPDVVDARYLAAILRGSWNDRFLVGTTVRRAKLSELEVPLVPLGDQQQVVTALDEMERLKKAAAAISEAGEALSSSLLDAVRFNITLTPPTDGQ